MGMVVGHHSLSLIKCRWSRSPSSSSILPYGFAHKFTRERESTSYIFITKAIRSTCATVTRQHCHPILDSYGSSYSSYSTVLTTAGRMTSQQWEDDNQWAWPLTHHQHFIHFINATELRNIMCLKKKDMHMDDNAFALVFTKQTLWLHSSASALGFSNSTSCSEHTHA